MRAGVEGQGVLASEHVGGRSPVTELPCYIDDFGIVLITLYSAVLLHALDLNKRDTCL